jgi:sulfoxide reductase heme-binding subunit YedZ
LNADVRVRWVLKPAVHALALWPLAALAWAVFVDDGRSLGANPVAEIIHMLGTWGLNFLLATLAISPLRELTGWPHWLRLRRMLGLYAFAYLLLHLLAYVVIDQGLAWDVLVEDVLERPWITIGVAGVLLLVPLAVTSTRGWMRRLGRRWQHLHRLIYPATALGLWHFYWQVKLDVREPLLYAGAFAVLMAWRVRHWRRAARRHAGQSGRRPAASTIPASTSTPPAAIAGVIGSPRIAHASNEASTGSATSTTATNAGPR